MIAPANATVRKFNPGTFQSDEEVRRQFVVRQDELDRVLEVLRENLDSPSCQHMMIVARRGMGKTMLLARVAVELRVSEELSASLLPVRFVEESHEVFDLTDFWLETLFHLAQEISDREPAVADELVKSRADLMNRTGPDVAGQVLAAVLDAADRLGRRLVLMVENMQSLCEDVDRDFGWELRGVLQTEPRIMLVNTATTNFEDLQRADRPFFELFRNLELKPLGTEGCRRLWTAISGDDMTGRQMRPLEILTGGSPRLLVIVAQFIRHRSLTQLLEELVTVIDEHTEYFRGHIEALPKGERRVYVTLMDLWQPSSASEVATRARMDVRAVSSLLGRLVTRGLVTFEGSSKQRRYAVTERLYSIYYKLRRERDEAALVLNLIRFMAAFYSDVELRGMWADLVRDAVKSRPIREGMLRALHDEGVAKALADSRSEMMDEMYRANEAGRYRDVLAVTDMLVGLHANDKTEELLDVLFYRANAHHELGEAEWEAAAYDEIARLFADRLAKARGQSARLLILKAMALTDFGSYAAAIESCLEVEELLREDSNDDSQVILSTALVQAGVALDGLGNHDAAKAKWRETVSRFGTSRHPDVQDSVAAAMVLEANSLVLAGSPDGALVLCDDVVARFGRSDVESLRTQAALALLTKVDVLVSGEQDEDAMIVAQQVEVQFGELRGPQGVRLAWTARCAQVGALGRLGRQKEALDGLGVTLRQFEPGDRTIQDVVRAVGELVSTGASAEELLDVVATGDQKADALGPLKLALSQECGREVRAPQEVLEVAADIRKDWQAGPPPRGLPRA